MGKLERILVEMKRNPRDVRFQDLRMICEHFFGKPRRVSGSHLIYAFPWAGDPRINIQNRKGKAKAYQFRQVLRAIEMLEDSNAAGK